MQTGFDIFLILQDAAHSFDTWIERDQGLEIGAAVQAEFDRSRGDDALYTRICLRALNSPPGFQKGVLWLNPTLYEYHGLQRQSPGLFLIDIYRVRSIKQSISIEP